MNSVSDAAGHPVLSISESMLLSLTDNEIIDEAEARAILEDATAPHRNAIWLADAAAHDEATTLIEAIIRRGNSVRQA
jgi:hypothetical protein